MVKVALILFFIGIIAACVGFHIRFKKNEFPTKSAITLAVTFILANILIGIDLFILR